MKKNQTIQMFFLTGLLAGFLCGIVPFLRTVLEHNYFKTGMYFLIAEQGVSQLAPWMAAGAIVFVLCGVIAVALGRFSRAVRLVAAVVYAGLLCAGVFILAQRLPGAASARAVLFLVVPSALLLFSRAGIWLQRRRTVIVASSLPCLFVLLAVFAWFGTQPFRSPQAGPSFVLIMIDCLRPDHLGCHGYARDTSPAIDALARVGWRYERAYAPAPWTKPSVAGVFSSQWSSDHGLVSPDHSAPDQMLMLAEVLRNAGYKNFFINGGNLFLKKEFNLHQGFHTYDYLPQQRSATGVVKAFLDRISGIGGEKFFAYLHYMDVHVPYTRNRYNTRYAEKIIKPYMPGNRATQLNELREPDDVTPQVRQYFQDLYDGQIRFVDDAIMALVQGLERLGRLDGTIFIITADHGEEFWEHGSTEHGHSLYNELLHVPLIIAGSSIKARLITEPVSLIDIMPTLLDLAAIPRERLGLKGVSIKPDSKVLSAARVLYASGTLYGPESYCLMQSGRKLIYRSNNDQGKWTLKGPHPAPGYQLYELNRDPGEQRDLAPTHGVPPDLDRQLADYLNSAPEFAPLQNLRIISKDMRRQLESLGYVQ
jgi:arylsulfatase A-like enzyme